LQEQRNKKTWFTGALRLGVLVFVYRVDMEDETLEALVLTCRISPYLGPRAVLDRVSFMIADDINDHIKGIVSCLCETLVVRAGAG
jgi:hypothetical protein